MAYTVELTDQQKKVIAQQIGAKMRAPLVSSAPGVAPPAHEITETFPVWVVDDRISSAPGGASNLLRAGARDTGTFHHNVSVVSNAPGAAPGSTQVVASARSMVHGPGGIPKIEAITTPPPGNNLPRWIRNAAYWIDKNAVGNPLIRLLVIPSRYAHCFWLSYPDKDCVVVIDMPASFTHLQYQHIYDSDEFFDLLQKEPVIKGLGPGSS